MKFGKITATISMVSFLLTACFPATPPPSATPAPTPTLDPCATIQIVSPRVESETNAAANPIDSETVIRWVPSNCVLTVQTYQNNKLMSETKDVVSETTLKIGEPGSGKTQIKVWWNNYETSTWVVIR
jgi:hypothetical protein